MSLKKIIIVGASGFGRELVEYIEDINKVSPQWEIKGFIDDNLNAVDDFSCDYKVLGSIKDWQPRAEEVYACALAFPEVKEQVVNLLQSRGAKFVSIIHPTARISRHASIGKGVVITPYSNVNSNAKVGDFVSILGSGVGHDAQIGNYTTLSGKCNINGHVTLGSKVYVGCGVIVAPSKTVGDNAVLGMGSVVVTNVKSGVKVFGNPAKKILI